MQMVHVSFMICVKDAPYTLGFVTLVMRGECLILTCLSLIKAGLVYSESHQQNVLEIA